MSKIHEMNPYSWIRPLLFRMDAEQVHHWTIKLLQKGLVPHFSNDTDPSLHVKVCGLDFPNPIGLAAVSINRLKL